MKRNSQRRLRPGSELDSLAGVLGKLLPPGRSLSDAERDWLLRLLVDVYSDRDVRDRFYAKKRGAPKDMEKQARAENCARWIAMRSRPGVETRLTVSQAKADAEKQFRMSTEQVRRAWLAFGAAMRALAKSVPSR